MFWSLAHLSVDSSTITSWCGFLSLDLLVKATVMVSGIKDVKHNVYHTGGQPS